jgi:hypothetical protein
LLLLGSTALLRAGASAPLRGLAGSADAAALACPGHSGLIVLLLSGGACRAVPPPNDVLRLLWLLLWPLPL